MKLSWNDVTPEPLVLNRRAVIAGLGLAAAGPALPARAAVDPGKPNSFEEITNYNNFYEFGFGKTDPAENAGALTTDPWAVDIGGMIDRPGSYSLADIAPANAVEDRIYRLRCVEAWSMVIPWQGVPLAGVLARVGVQPSAKFVEFQTLLRPEEMPEQRRRSLDWPYVEGLRLDEAMHPLTLLATGLYGKPLPNQNGAPIRLVVPWKYGFKSAKSLVRITLTDRQPVSTWQAMQPSEYGFYANVNPGVDHPRWSQATERPIGAGLFGGRKETLMFNGYADEVAHLYAGMDLARDY
ncbi:protein-methionine-sulfoxide reductase catalytic subunit MsrP [Paracoccus aeridis]|uniref:protein-methionine-sulfoxide reductase catalytic subunit MsrP n=1 Tax=Paracoccus aeridis TaxID=1966466 RepID=UPI0010AAB8A7|nr:protein-methionine-sulfoxide reductase catalytic subunit MsrP [Paracoccus aeridis]